MLPFDCFHALCQFSRAMIWSIPVDAASFLVSSTIEGVSSDSPGI